MRYCAALCNCRYIHTLWCLATDLMCHSLPVFLSYSLLAGGYWEFHRGKPVPFAILDFWGARHLFVDRRSPRSSASCIIQNGGHENSRRRKTPTPTGRLYLLHHISKRYRLAGPSFLDFLCYVLHIRKSWFHVTFIPKTVGANVNLLFPPDWTESSFSWQRHLNNKK